MPESKKQGREHRFDKLNSLHRITICLAAAVIVYLVIQIRHLGVITHLMIGWNVFSLGMIVLSWITFSITTSQEIREFAKAQDSSRVIIFIVVLISTFASFDVEVINNEGACESRAKTERHCQNKSQTVAKVKYSQV